LAVILENPDHGWPEARLKSRYFGALEYRARTTPEIFRLTNLPDEA
jgi:hypothetical protein